MLAKRSLPLVILAIACLSFSVQKPSDKKFWAKQYAQINSMFEHKDAVGFEGLLAPDYYEIDQAGKKLDREAFIKAEVEPMTQAGKVISNAKVTSISVKGDDAQIGYDWKYTIFSGDTKTVGREIGTDGWRKTNGKWMNITTVVKSSTEKTTPLKAKKKH